MRQMITFRYSDVLSHRDCLDNITSLSILEIPLKSKIKVVNMLT